MSPLAPWRRIQTSSRGQGTSLTAHLPVRRVTARSLQWLQGLLMCLVLGNNLQLPRRLPTAPRVRRQHQPPRRMGTLRHLGLPRASLSLLRQT